jgi:hypothetical protein
LAGSSPRHLAYGQQQGYETPEPTATATVGHLLVDTVEQKTLRRWFQEVKRGRLERLLP